MSAPLPPSDEALREAFHRAAIAFLAWRGDNDRKAVMSYVAYHRLALMPLHYPAFREGGGCAYPGEPKISYGGRAYRISTISRYASRLTGALPPLLRALFEDVITGQEGVTTYDRAAECLSEYIELEHMRLHPRLQLNDNQPVHAV